MKIKNTLSNLLFILINSSLNIAVFMVAYKSLIFPLLHEDQRMDIAPYIFSHVFPSFLLISTITILSFKWILKNRIRE